MSFDHEKLVVYQRALEFIKRIEPFTEIYDSTVIENLDKASMFMAVNIAEGTGKFLPGGKSGFYEAARGAALQCAAYIDILIATNKIDETETIKIKNILYEIVSMLTALIKSSGDHVYEPDENYGTGLN